MLKILIKKIRSKKGFTLVEVLIVTVALAILMSLLTGYFIKTVEKSRAANPMLLLSSIAKAQSRYHLMSAHYTQEIKDLDIGLRNFSDNSIASGNTFDTEFFDYKIYGDDKQFAVAMRKTKEYELLVYYPTGEIFCRPQNHPICKAFGLLSGGFLKNWEGCNSRLDFLFESVAGVPSASYSKEKSANSCNVASSAGRTDFEICFDKTVTFITQMGSQGAAGGWQLKCSRGFFIEPSYMVYSVCRDSLETCHDERVVATQYHPNGNKLLELQCWGYDFDEEVCGHGFIYQYSSDGSQVASLSYCDEFYSDNTCKTYRWCQPRISGACAHTG